jgi:hypothetical protein
MSPQLENIFRQSGANATVNGGTVFDYLIMALDDLRCVMATTSEGNPLLVIDAYVAELRRIK